MATPTQLGGLKILREVAGFSVILPIGREDPVVKFCRSLAEKKINLPYFTLLRNRRTWGLNSMVDSGEGLRVSLMINENFGQGSQQVSDMAILSIFPHQKNPEIAGRLFEVLENKDIKPFSIANSPSAISIVLQERFLNKTSQALFESFNFGSYHSPVDWKLAHKGREEFHKEIVASYQEKKPKIYAIELFDCQEMFLINLDKSGFRRIVNALRSFAGLNLSLSFIATGPLGQKRNALAICIPESSIDSSIGPFREYISHPLSGDQTAVAVFSMNGPHFGDRYGIVMELLAGFEQAGIDLIGLSCTVASITGVIPSTQSGLAIESIKRYFDVPSVIKR
ncbi:MAG: hypothetical protein JW882_00270 [Deltaproteobacteria bacterium]|nr:hypothetical protein [Deltaproteobacteria bacterium]